LNFLTHFGKDDTWGHTQGMLSGTFNNTLMIQKVNKEDQVTAEILLDKIHSFCQPSMDWLVSVLPVRQIKNSIARDRAVVAFARVVKLRALAHLLYTQRNIKDRE
jgi:hypothetical protein